MRAEMAAADQSRSGGEAVLIQTWTWRTKTTHFLTKKKLQQLALRKRTNYQPFLLRNKRRNPASDSTLVLTSHPQPAEQPSLVLTSHSQPAEQSSLVLTSQPQPTEQSSLVLTSHPQAAEQSSLVLTSHPQPAQQSSLVLTSHLQPAQQSSVVLTSHPQLAQQSSLVSASLTQPAENEPLFARPKPHRYVVTRKRGKQQPPASPTPDLADRSVSTNPKLTPVPATPGYKLPSVPDYIQKPIPGSMIKSAGQKGSSGPALFRDPFMDSDHVAGLKLNSYRNFLAKRDMTMVMFYSPYVPGCEMFKEQFVKAAETTSRPNHAYAAVDCLKEDKLCAVENVVSVPFFKLYSRGQVVLKLGEIPSLPAYRIKDLVETAEANQ